MTIMEEEIMNELELNAKDTTLSMQWLNDGCVTEETNIAVIVIFKGWMSVRSMF